MARTPLSRFAVLSIAGSLSAGMAVLPSTPGGAESRRDEGARVTNCNSSGSGSLADAVAGARSGSTITISASCSSENPITPADVITIGTSLTIKASRSERAVISGGTTHSIFTVAPGAVVSLEGLTLRDGHQGTFSFVIGGGAIQNGGTLSLIHDAFINNSSFVGGAVSNTGSLTVDGCTFRTGSAYVGSSILSSQGSVRISNSEISDNWAIFGTLFLVGSAFTIRHSVVTRNKAYLSGGIFVSGDPAVSSLLISDSTISDNQRGQAGGGLTVGGVPATIEHSTISNNTATDGAGIENESGALTVRDSVFSGNTASGQGGAIFSNGESASVAVNSSRFSNNAGASLPTKYPGIYIFSGTLKVRGSDFGSSRDGDSDR